MDDRPWARPWFTSRPCARGAGELHGHLLDHHLPVGPDGGGPTRRLALAAGAIGTVTGAVVLVANVGTTFLLAILGVVIALTGLAHPLVGFELADRSVRD